VLHPAPPRPGGGRTEGRTRKELETRRTLPPADKGCQGEFKGNTGGAEAAWGRAGTGQPRRLPLTPSQDRGGGVVKDRFIRLLARLVSRQTVGRRPEAGRDGGEAQVGEASSRAQPCGSAGRLPAAQSRQFIVQRAAPPSAQNRPCPRARQGANDGSCWGICIRGPAHARWDRGRSSGQRWSFPRSCVAFGRKARDQSGLDPSSDAFP
jgi:hypothetical protein